MKKVNRVGGANRKPNILQSHDIVSRLDICDTLANRLHDTSTLMT